MFKSYIKSFFILALISLTGWSVAHSIFYKKSVYNIVSDISKAEYSYFTITRNGSFIYSPEKTSGIKVDDAFVYDISIDVSGFWLLFGTDFLKNIPCELLPPRRGVRYYYCLQQPYSELVTYDDKNHRRYFLWSPRYFKFIEYDGSIAR